MLGPRARVPRLCAQASQAWENARPPAILWKSLLPAHALQLSRTVRSPGRAVARMAWLLPRCSRWLLLFTVFWLHRPSLWSGSVATLGSIDLELRSTAFPVRLARHLPVSNCHLQSS